MVVYALHAGDMDYRYVGITKNRAIERLRGHRYGGRVNARYAVSQWIHRCGPENVQMRILGTALTYRDLKDAEIFWIAELKELGYDLVNMTKGGDGTHGYTSTLERNRRIGEAFRGRKWSDEHRKRISDTKKGMPNPGCHNRWHVDRRTVDTTCVFCIASYTDVFEGKYVPSVRRTRCR